MLARVEGTRDVALDVLAVPGDVQPGEAGTWSTTPTDFQPSRVGLIPAAEPGEQPRALGRHSSMELGAGLDAARPGIGRETGLHSG